MKKILFSLLLLGFGLNEVTAGTAEYVQAVEQINADYQTESRQFLRALNPQQQGFTVSQNQQFCGIVQRYVDRLYQAADQNRAYLGRQFQNLNKQDVIQQVKSSKEMQLLKRYHVECHVQ